MSKEVRQKLFNEGYKLWFKLVNVLEPDIMLISIPFSIVRKNLNLSKPRKLVTFTHKAGGESRSKPYTVLQYECSLLDNKVAKVYFGQAAQKPFGTISIEQKEAIGKAIRRNI